ncbi:myeloid-associated differentiation marker-like [Moschus berezovskii]|uniref:myeloid-associated differentiation marker-like n=1 Tax=Moschus berezovskii TaxID=68408 RepID=UPI0024452901|nr:myeloid-associated differentiation marker-like [Moschus berezovskii]
MSLLSGLDSVAIVGYFLRLGQLLSTGVPFSLVAVEDTLRAGIGNRCLFLWSFCFSASLLILLTELCIFQSRIPHYWDGFLHVYAYYFAFICLSASIMFGITYIQYLPQGPVQNYAITATAFSAMASVLYALEVPWVCARPGNIYCFVPTTQGVIRRLENAVACVIFGFITNTDLYQHQPALIWCVVVYSICFILGAVNFFINGCDRDNDRRLSIPYPGFLVGQTVLSILLYTTAVILWPLYQFDKDFGGQPQRSNDMTCSGELPPTLCVWDQRLAVAILTAINLLAYVADSAYMALVFVG